MDRLAIFMILAGVIVSAVGIIVLGGTVLGDWFGEESRSTIKTIAAAAPFFGLVLLGCGGSRSGTRSTRIAQ